MKVTKTWYRSVLKSNGVLWCESSIPGEVIRRSEGFDVTFQKLVTVEIDNGWEDWDATQ